MLLLLLLLLWRVQLHAMARIARTVAHLAHCRIDTAAATATALADIGNVTVAVATAVGTATSAARVGARLLWVLVGRRYTRWSPGCHRMAG
uniref:Putative secreted protein n=1 Tax=Anopheles marajoara TaxID=58244 RepID=A0A2M4C9Z1_9DIPT